MLRSTGSVFGLVIVEVVLRDDLDDRQRLKLFAADDRYRQFLALDVALHQHLVVDLEHLVESLLDLIFPFDDAHTQRASFGRRFHNAMGAKIGHQSLRIVRLASMQRHRRRCGDTLHLVKLLGFRLVHRQRARPHARPRVRQTNRFQKPLHGAIFSVFAVQAEKNNIKRAVDQSLEIVLACRIENRDVVSGFLKSLPRAFPRRERHFALPALPSCEQRHSASRHVPFFRQCRHDPQQYTSPLSTLRNVSRETCIMAAWINRSNHMASTNFPISSNRSGNLHSGRSSLHNGCTFIMRIRTIR